MGNKISQDRVGVDNSKKCNKSRRYKWVKVLRSKSFDSPRLMTMRYPLLRSKVTQVVNATLIEIPKRTISEEIKKTRLWYSLWERVMPTWSTCLMMVTEMLMITETRIDLNMIRIWEANMNTMAVNMMRASSSNLRLLLMGKIWLEVVNNGTMSRSSRVRQAVRSLWSKILRI